MQTVDSILTSVYGTDAKAAERLRVVRSAVSNWKTWGYFPSRLAVPIWEHARAAGVEIDVTEIPTMHNVQQGAA